MASPSSDNDESSIDNPEKWEDLSSLVSQTTLSNPTDNPKHVSGADGQFLEGANVESEVHLDEFLVETENWAKVNARLKHHGLRPIKPVPFNEATEIQSGVFLDEAEAHMLRNTIERLIDDCERRQALVQELITSSNKLQEEANEKSDKAYRYDREIGRFRKELKSQQSKIQELEQKRLDELRNHGEEMQAMSIAKADLQARYDVLDQKCVEMQQEIVELRYQNQELVAREQDRQIQIAELPRDDVSTIKDETTSQESKTSQRTEKDVDDDYPANQDSPTASELDDVLESTPKNVESTPETVDDDLAIVGNATKKELLPGARILERKLKTTEKHVEESKKLIDLLEAENNKLKAELKGRPSLDEWKKAWKYNKRLEKVLLDNNLSISFKRSKETELSEKRRIKKYKTQVKDIDFLPIDICRKYIKRVCLKLNISDLKEILPMLESYVLLGETQERMESLIRQILQVIDVSYTLLDDISDSSEPRDHAAYCEKAWKLILPTLKKWSSEIKRLKDLKEEVVRLTQDHFPWKRIDELFPQDNEYSVTVEDIRNALEKITMDKDRAKPRDLQEDKPTSVEQLQSIVAHFQKLFDVKSIVGVFPRMNEVYTKIGETYNVMKTIREALGLDANASSVVVVNAIGKIQTAKHFLKIQDLPGIIKRLEEYDEFFPAFQFLVSQLYDLLDVDKMDEILTAVKALIQFPQK